MKKKSALKKGALKLDLEKIEIDVLTDSMLNSLQGGYNTQPNPLTICATHRTCTEVGCTFGCQTQAYTCTDPYVCCNPTG